VEAEAAAVGYQCDDGGYYHLIAEVSLNTVTIL
jgi:hypothetical protein